MVKKKAIKKAKIRVNLGNKLSVMLRQAVSDARAVERMKRYKLNMNVWHERWDNHKETPCSVCLAGATLIKRSNARLSDNIYELDRKVTPLTSRKLQAINDMRSGSFSEALFKLRGGGRAPTTGAQHEALRRAMFLVTDSYVSDRAPWAVYLAAADALAEAGL